mgnify:CR=1 FL=1
MKSKLKGVTLVETMLYIGLFSIIILMVLNFMMSTQESTLRNNRRGVVYKASEFIIQHFGSSFDNAISISNTNSLFQNDQGVLELSFSDGAKQYSLADSTLYFDSVPISPPDISVNKFFLEPLYNGDPTIPVAVRISIEIISNEDSDIADTINILSTLR